MPPRHFPERDPPRCLDRETHSRDQFVIRARRRQHAPLEIACGEHTGPALGPHHDVAAERRQHQRKFRGRVGVGDRAADRALVAGLEVADERQRRRDQRQRRGEVRPILELVLGHGGADFHHAADHPDVIQFRQPPDIDQHRRLGDAQVEHRHQRLPARQHAGGVAMLRKNRNGFLHAVRAHIIEPARFQVRPRGTAASRAGRSVASS
jgi:hypothetical protein